MVYYLQVLEITWHIEGQTAKLQVERERESEWARGSALIVVDGGFSGSLFIGEFVTQSKHLKHLKRKNNAA